MHSSGRPDNFNASLRESTIAVADRSPSFPLRKITALPDFRHKPPASAATLGLLSKISPMTPRGVATLEIFKPLGLSQEARTLPTGSLNDLISVKVSHIPWSLLLSNAKRSIKASSFLLFSAALISS